MSPPDRASKVKFVIPPPSSWLPVDEAVSPIRRLEIHDPPARDTGAAGPVGATNPGVFEQELFSSAPPPATLPEPIPAPAPTEPTSTAFETVTESTFTPAPEPAVAFVAEPPAPERTDRVSSVTAEHPEYLIVAALVAGFLLAKVVKKLAA